MSLGFYDDQFNPLTTVLRTFHDGHLGSVMEKLVYVRNDDGTKYYTNVVVSYLVNTYLDLGVMGTTGWSVKMMTGQRQPTEAEWDEVQPGQAVVIDDIGSIAGADTSTYSPVWVRVSCPGNEIAQIRENQKLQLTAFERLVGA